MPLILLPYLVVCDGFLSLM